MPDALKRAFALLLIFTIAFLSVSLFRTWQGGYPLFGFRSEDHGGQFSSENPTLASKATFQPEDVPGLSSLNQEMTQIVEKVTPSVVSINTEIVKTETHLDPFSNQIITKNRLAPGLGSGVIVSEEGHVITNYHVIEGYQKIRVKLHNGRSLPAKVINSDELLDIAVLRVESQGNETFKPLKFADSDLVKVGQLAIAIGNPFGLGESVTVGHISARDRSYSDDKRDMFQIDAAINPGHSGGPLLNHLGEIIAINASIYSPNQSNPSFQGIGFSIPSNDVKRSFDYICDKGRPVYGYLGLQVSRLNDYLRSVFSYTGEGVTVDDIFPDSPAAKAGIKPNDIIISYDREGVITPEDFLNRIRRTIVGKEIDISVWRGDQIINLKATTGEADPFASAKRNIGSSRITSDRAILAQIGIQVRNTSTQFRLQGIHGVFITKILPGSLAEQLGLEVQDIILDINGSRVRNDQDFYFRLVASAAVQETQIQYLKRGKPFTLSIPQVPRTD